MIGKKINELATELAPLSTDLTIIGDPTTGVSKKITLEQISSLFGGSVSFYTNLAGFPSVGNIDIIYCAKDTNKLYLWSGSAYTEIFPSQALLDTYQLRSEKGNANGYASLDSGGKVPISQLPSSLMEYKGTWNAATNTPTLANGTGDTGDVYICNVAGTVNFGAGPLTFAVGDYVIYSGTIWQRSSGAVGTVTSVALTVGGDAISVSGSPLTTSGTLGLTFNGTTAQYIRGNGTLETFPSLTGFVPYTGATANVNLGTYSLSAYDLIINHTSGSGVAASITKGGNGEALTVVKSSGSGNAASITGGVTLLDELHLNTDLADAYIASATNWNAAYNDKINSAAVTGTTTKTLTLTQQDGGTITASWTDDNTDAVTSVFGRTGAVVAVSGDYTTSLVTEGTNLYFTNARARAAISAGTGISYNSSTGVITNTITQYTDALARAAISLTTTGTSGAATYNNTTGVLNIPQYADQFVGTVTSVGLSAPTGFSVSGSPVTSSGTLALAFASGYSLPTTAKQTTWDTAYDRSLTAASVSGTTTKTLTLTKQDGSTLTASWTDINTDAVTSVFGRTGAVVATSGDYTTAQVTESGNLYFTNARAIASTLTGYTSGAGTITSSDSILSAIQKLNGNIGALTTGVSSVNGFTGAVTLTTSNIAEGTNLYYTEARVNANTNVAANTAARHNAVTIGTANGLSLSTQVLSLGLASTSTTGALSSTDWNTFNNKTSNTGTVTSVGLSSATSGVTIGSTPITTSGTITLAIATASGSQQGLLSSTDWTTFNNKQSALTNPVTGTGTTNYLPKFTGASTIGNSAIYDNSGNIGINTISADAKLQIVGSFAQQIRFGTSTSVYTNMSMGTGYTVFDTIGGEAGAGAFDFRDDGVRRMFLDASGNLGLGVTPSAWSLLTALQISGGAILAGYGGATYLGQNFYYGSGGDTYISNGYSTRYTQFNGQHLFFTAPSGTAGNAISFTQAMTLNASGNLSIGNTNDTYKLDVSGTGRFVNASTFQGIFSGWSTSGVNSASGAISLGNTAAYRGVISYAADGDTTLSFDNSYDSTGAVMRFRMRTAGTAVNALTIAGTGAATFSSSVTAGNLFVSYSGTNAGIEFGNSGGGGQFGFLKWDNASNYVYLGHSYGSAFNRNLVINSSGNVGIGTTAPTAPLTVAGTTDLAWSASTSKLQISRSGTVARLQNYDNGSAASLALQWEGGNVGIGTTSPAALLDVNGIIRNNGSNVNLIKAGTSGITAINFGDASSGDVGQIYYDHDSNFMRFGVNDSERMRITSGGSIAINTTSPTNFGSGYNVVSNNGTSSGIYESRVNNAQGGNWGSDVTQTFMYEPRNLPITFGTQNTERMRITSGGNVEINTGSIKTGEPDTGWGRAAIKIGQRQSGEAFSSGGYLPVNVDGTVYYINLYSSTP